MDIGLIWIGSTSLGLVSELSLRCMGVPLLDVLLLELAWAGMVFFGCPEFEIESYFLHFVRATSIPSLRRGPHKLARSCGSVSVF